MIASTVLMPEINVSDMAIRGRNRPEMPSPAAVNVSLA
jgi:hypothetical protein